MKVITNLPQHLGGVKWDEIEGKPKTYPPSSHTHSKSDVGLGSVDNTADANKSVKYAASAGNADTVDGKHASEFAPSSHTHAYASLTGRPTGLDSGYVRTGQKAGTTIGSRATAEGLDVDASGASSHAEGVRTIASGMGSHAEGGNLAGARANEASGYGSHVEGAANLASGSKSHAGGSKTTASGDNSFSTGYETTASGVHSFACGRGTIASSWAQMVIGDYNVQHGTETNALTSYFIVGNGTSSARSNAFRVHNSGACYGKSAWNSSGADYAEYYEWLDKNKRTEDRRGYFVTMVGKEIVKATPNDDYILGIVSAHPVVIGNSDPDNWHDRFLKDDFGNYIMKMITEKVPAGVNEDGEEIFEEVEREAYMQNPDFDESQDAGYIPRDQRPEWSPIGMVGMLTVWDDGTCEVDGFCKCNGQSGATKSNPVEYEIIDGKIRKNYRVVERVNDELIRVIFR